MKPTDGCNARCRYCSAAHGGAAKVMSSATLRAVFRLFGDWAAYQPHSRLRFIWHGGEPLLMPAAFWDRVHDEGASLEARGIRVEHAIQTNATRIEDATLPMLQRLLGPRGVVGTSMDPTAGIRELKGEPDGAYQARWEAGIARLRGAGIRYGLVFVVHRLVLPRLEELYRSLRSAHPEAGIRFNPLYRQGRAKEQGQWEDLGISAVEWGEALRRLHRVWEEEGRPGNILPFGPWSKLHESGAWRLSCECSGKCVSTHFGVDPGGTVHLCGRSADGGVFGFGQAADLDGEALRNHPLRRTLGHRSVYLRRTTCAACPWWSYCHGGCINDALLDHATPFAPTSFCEGLKAFFAEAFPVGADGRAS